jgi:DNA-binding transcriptional regulator YiaG
MSDEEARFYIDGQEIMAEPYLYKACGLDDIYLLNGVEKHESAYGRGISVHNAKALHREIGHYLIMHRKALSPKEIRFLRKEMEMTQEELGDCLGITGQTVARYEKGETEIPGPVDQLTRFCFAFYLMPQEERAKVMEEVMEAVKEMRQMDEAPPMPVYFGATGQGWDEARRLAA